MKKLALVTGGNKGIGLAVSRLLLDKGFGLIILARNVDEFELADHPDVKAIAFDLSQIDAIAPLIDSLPPIDVLVNNAGIMLSLPYDDYPQASIEQTLQLNIAAPVALITAVSAAMRQRGGGRIINNTSIAGHIGHPDIWYGVSKAGLINATKSFAKLLGGDNVLVNAVAAGPVNTDMLASIDDSRKAAIKQNTIAGRFAEAEEVAETIVWLATDAPSYLNGTIIDLNNGSFPR
ncbi:3-oxoacyl-[acyl-carrier-protein] reductase FabG [Sinobacterium norvegicum]|uniref:3-oxoacyl-[acyl-carrier-protein] reductase FabG n=1 Tax=Sinobacterium norvegicum TaxID=1641715 RepID=A0ABN8EFI7_9GAMM|nr:SDR family oxidoreductase [Sinobacterium norvegicum]CAH0990057.1 3-oxoacyl-[acyl-carrier-protein] reductase FabG [Sinobacterium norvegicum]